MIVDTGTNASAISPVQCGRCRAGFERQNPSDEEELPSKLANASVVRRLDRIKSLDQAVTFYKHDFAEMNLHELRALARVASGLPGRWIRLTRLCQRGGPRLGA